ncbi:DNA N(6)-methyladenine demethylase ALKBH1D-like isoform X1 [Aristolochia californica]|uniref:DNA N(6)-methyladenine demethylase ALKBH1D-like isoform X1 n=1 Tax=Aristolochia californica TaxID=171875 RepID=UPI0035E212C3
MQLRGRTFKELYTVQCLLYSRQNPPAFPFSSSSKMEGCRNPCENSTSKANRYTLAQRASGHRGKRGGQRNQGGRSNPNTHIWKSILSKDCKTVSVSEDSHRMTTPCSADPRTPEINVQEENEWQQEELYTKRLNLEPASDDDTASKSSGPSLDAISLPEQHRQYASDKNVSCFDIFHDEKKGPVKLNSSLFRRKRQRRNELAKNCGQIEVLRPGMILLKAFISHTNQVEIVKSFRTFGVGFGGFYQPGYRDGSKLRLRMMCLGKDWDPETRLYTDVRSMDGAKPPPIPNTFGTLVEEAIQASHDYIKAKDPNIHSVEEILPRMSPDLCIVNFYTDSGKLGLHQDKDESPQSIEKELPVVSFSIGDSAEFAYSEKRDADNAAKVVLESGDVLIFGGKSRLIFHGVPRIHPGTAPEQLLEETNLRPGRLNLTFRKF